MGYCLISIPYKTSRFVKDICDFVEKNLDNSSRLSLICSIFFPHYFVPCVFWQHNANRDKLPRREICNISTNSPKQVLNIPSALGGYTALFGTCKGLMGELCQ